MLWWFLHSSTPLRASPCTSVGYTNSVHGSAAPCAVMQCDSWRLGTLPAGGKSNVCVAIRDGCSYHRLMLLHPWGGKKYRSRLSQAGHICHHWWTSTAQGRSQVIIVYFYVQPLKCVSMWLMLCLVASPCMCIHQTSPLWFDWNKLGSLPSWCHLVWLISYAADAVRPNIRQHC